MVNRSQLEDMNGNMKVRWFNMSSVNNHLIMYTDGG